MCQEWIRSNQGAAAVSSYSDNSAGKRSWRYPRGRHNTDLDHVAVFPSTIPLTYRRLLDPLEPGLDHLPVMVSFPTDFLGVHVHVGEHEPHHVPRLQTQDFHEQEPVLWQVIANWWAEEQATQASLPHPSHLSDHLMLQCMLHAATHAYAMVSGWSKTPGPRRERILPGHLKLRRELDALFVFQRVVQQGIDAAGIHRLQALNEDSMTAS